MKDFEVLKPLNAPDINYKQLAISVSYSLGGMNYFSGQQSARGIYAYFTPCSSGANGLRSSTLMGSQRESGFKVLLEEMARKKPARVKFWAERVAGMADKIAELYEIGDNGAIMDLVKGKSEALATPYVLHVDGRTEKLPDTELETLQKAVGGYIEMVAAHNGNVIILDEEGKIKNKPINAEATRMFINGQSDPIVGDVVIASAEQIK
jgi:hypothetical protein